MSEPKMQFCFNCGKELGIYVHYHGDIESCGSAECNREEQAAYREQREEAHHRLDEEMGWR